MQRVNGKWRVQVRVGGKIKGHTFTRKADAERMEAELKRQKELVRTGTLRPEDKTLVIDATGDWMRRRVKDVTVGTLAADDQRLRKYALPYIGTSLVTAVTTGDVIRLLDAAQERHGISNSTRNKIRMVLHTFFEDAFMREQVIANPVAKVPVVPESPERKEPVPADAWEEYIASGYKMTDLVGFALMVMFFEGLRISQVCGLKHKDFDLESGALHSRRIWEAARKGIREGIKGRPDGLTIPLFPRVREAYLAYRRKSAFTAPEDYVFCNAKGEPLSTDALRNRIFWVCHKFELEEITPHLCRAAFATEAERAGYSREDVQRLMGHASMATTQIYIRPKADALKARGEEIGFGASVRSLSRQRHAKARSGAGRKRD